MGFVNLGLPPQANHLRPRCGLRHRALVPNFAETDEDNNIVCLIRRVIGIKV